MTHERMRCAICGHTDPMKRTLWTHHWLREVLAVVIGGNMTESLWRDVGMMETCGACMGNPPDGWKRYS